MKYWVNIRQFNVTNVTHNYNFMYYFQVFYQYVILLIGIVMILRWYWVVLGGLGKSSCQRTGRFTQYTITISLQYLLTDTSLLDLLIM